MHKLITAALLATTIASPLMAQDHPGDHGPDPYGHSARDQDRTRPTGQNGRPDQRGQEAPRDFQGRPGPGQQQDGGRPDFQRRGDDRGFAGRAPGPDRGPDFRPGASFRPGPDGRPGPGNPPAQDANRGQAWRGGDHGPDRGPPGGWQDRSDIAQRRGHYDDRGPGGWNGRGPDRRGPDQRGWDQHGWDQRWRADDRYDWRGYRAGHRDEFQVPGYYAPGGYGYRRFDPGYRIGAQFYDRRYWILDPYEYRLPPAYGPYRWVRYFDDVLLIDLRTGLVVDSVPGFFY